MLVSTRRPAWTARRHDLFRRSGLRRRLGLPPPDAHRGNGLRDDRIPQTWVDVWNRFDLILVPSQTAGGRFSIRCPSSDPGRAARLAQLPPLGLKRRRDPLIFYNSANANIPAGEPRGVLALLSARLPGRRDVCLRLRAKRTSSIRRYLIRYSIGRMTRYPLESRAGGHG